MRFSIVTVTGVFAALTCGFSAQAQSPWYVTGAVGGYEHDKTEGAQTFFKDADPSVTTKGTESRTFKPGILAEVGVGYHVSSQWRVEADFDYAGFTGNTLTPSTTDLNFPRLNGAFTRQSGANNTRFMGSVIAFYDFLPAAARFNPYVGLGLGAESAHDGAGVYVNAAGVPFSGSGDSSSEGYGLAEVGVSIALTSRLSLVPAYRYMHFMAGDQASVSIGKVGLRYAF
jgi:opacity protein-like surface antigen